MQKIIYKSIHQSRNHHLYIINHLHVALSKLHHLMWKKYMKFMKLCIKHWTGNISRKCRCSKMRRNGPLKIYRYILPHCAQSSAAINIDKSRRHKQLHPHLLRRRSQFNLAIFDSYEKKDWCILVWSDARWC